MASNVSNSEDNSIRSPSDDPMADIEEEVQSSQIMTPKRESAYRKSASRSNSNASDCGVPPLNLEGDEAGTSIDSSSRGDTSTADVSASDGSGTYNGTSPRHAPQKNPFPKDRPLIVGICGGTGCGKTYVAKDLERRLGAKSISFISQDNYYKDLSHMPEAERAQQNFDHPDTLDLDLLADHLETLSQMKPVNIPTYDFATHTRCKGEGSTLLVQPSRVIIVEGILIFAYRRLREIIDVKVFVDADSDIRFIRRLKRDIKERGRTTESVISQYLATVRPMHLEFVEPTKRYADIIIPHNFRNDVAMSMVSTKIRAVLES
eukprot:g4078.t1